MRPNVEQSGVPRGDGPARAGIDPHGPDPGESADLVDWALIGSFCLFVVRSVGRHKWVFLAVWAAIVGASLGMMAVLPKTYHIETALQAQRNQVVAALSNPGRVIPGDADAPTRQAAETVSRHDNLVALIQQTDFIKNWYAKRAPLFKLKDRIWRLVFKPPSRAEELDDFVYYLRTRLWVATGDGTLTFGLDLPDPVLGYHVVDTAVQNFLEARRAADISSIVEAITILENRAREQHETLSSSLQQLQALRNARAVRSVKRTRETPPQLRKPRPADPETSQLLSELEGKRRAIDDLEESRRRRTLELQTRLQEQRAIYSEHHPNVLELEQSLNVVRQPSPQVDALKHDVAALEEELKKHGSGPELASGEVGRVTPVVIEAKRVDANDPREGEDSELDAAKEQVRFQLASYNSLLDRIDGARLEFESASAAFKYRYTVLRPVRIPRQAIKPKRLLVLSASLLAGLVLAILSSALIDLWSGIFLENWQIEHKLGVRLLGEIRSRSQ
jgi:hypothetical protein